VHGVVGRESETGQWTPPAQLDKVARPLVADGTSSECQTASIGDAC
jgi:hypothetical protein